MTFKELVRDRMMTAVASVDIALLYFESRGNGLVTWVGDLIAGLHTGALGFGTEIGTAIVAMLTAAAVWIQNHVNKLEG